jgi:fructokinase
MQIGIDFGGTKIEAAAIDSKGGFAQRIRAANPGNYDSAVRTVQNLVLQVESDLGVKCTVGIGTPGSISPTTGVMRNSNSLYLNGRSFREDLSEALAREVRMANDANCFTLSEATDGAAAGANTVFGVILGTGCGGGLFAGGRLIEGANGVGGEWGHNPLPWPTPAENPGPRCYCGQRGCLEQWISGTGLQRDYAEHAGQSKTAEQIVSLARSGDPHGRDAFDRLIDRLARGLATICNVVDPDVIVVGGGLSNVREIYDRLPALISAHVFSDAWRGRIAAAKWGDSSGVRGAARLWAEAPSPAKQNATLSGVGE